MKEQRMKVTAPANSQAVSSKEHEKKYESMKNTMTDESMRRRQLKKTKGYQRKMQQTWTN
jgi:hypothetical protein